MIVYNGKVVMHGRQSFGLNTPVRLITQAMAVRDGKFSRSGPTTPCYGWQVQDRQD
jgi:hypothetical protein